MTVVCGVDVGSLRTSSAVAWLSDGRLEFSAYRPSAEGPLPQPPVGVEPAVAAHAWARGLALRVGAAPTVDPSDRVLREGFIVVPAPP